MVLTVTKCLEFGFAMDGRVCTPKRVKDILSSFLHDVIPDDVPQQSSSEEALPHTGGGETTNKVDRPTRCASATDRTAFFLRVHTYSPLTWFAKPAWFSALVCARYGWVNVDVDVLQCVGCGNHLSGRMLRSFEPQVYAECCKKLVDSLKTAHSAFCCWVSHPSPESFLRLPLSSRAMAEMEFVTLLKSLLRLQAELPRIEAVQLESMGLTRATLLSLRHYVGTTDQSCDDGSHDLDDMFCSACMLAVCGWASSSSAGVSHLRCRYCNRTAGLWNYHTHASPSPPAVCDESHDNGNSLSPGGDTCGAQSKSHDSSSGSPAGGTACCPTPESSDVAERSVEDADESSTGSDSQEEDVSEKGMSAPTDDARDEGGEGGVTGGSGKQESDSSSGNISNGDSESESTSNDESGAENGTSDDKLAEEDSEQQVENEALPGSSEEDNEQTGSEEKECSEEMINDSNECCVQTESDNDKSIEQTETDRGENDKEEQTDKTENDKEEQTDRTESDNEDRVEQTKNESDNSQQSDTGAEVDTVDGCCLQEAKCIERCVEVDIKPQHDITQPVDLKSNNLKTDNQEERSADESECEDVGKGGKSTVGEGDEPMEVDALGADKDETGQRTTVDSSENGSPTGQRSLDSGQNGVTSHTGEEVEPAAKRRKLMKPTRVTFDPVAEHHTWCPWVLPDVATDRSHDTLTAGDEHRQPGWRRFLEMLTPADSQHSHSLISIVKTSPPCVGLRSIRKLFLGWTKTATPDS